MSREDVLRFSRELQREEDAGSWSDDARMAAYLFCVNTDAWRQLCDEMNIDPDATLNGVPGADEVERMHSLMRHVAFDAEQAGSYLKRDGDESAEAVRAGEMTGEMHDALKEWATVG